MPFKLRLKQSRQYNVLSKSLFVCCVELLDGNSLECTLGSESTGRDCLDNVCQRLGLHQPDFFGLIYTLKNSARHRWLEMDKPVKKQLDKHADGPNLLLRVMFYVTGNIQKLLTDETSRYHYFLQVKMDVIEGRIEVTPQQAIVLASYSMQAEFGDYDSERHTPDYLKDFQLFPKDLIDGEMHLKDRLTERATVEHAKLKGLSQSVAEEQYIVACQRLDGYGHEHFVAKDENHREVIVGININGVVVFYPSDQITQSKVYLWKDIRNVINHKRYFKIEGTSACDTAQFQFIDSDSAEQVWRQCVHQHTFFQRITEKLQQSTTADGIQSAGRSSNTRFEKLKNTDVDSNLNLNSSALDSYQTKVYASSPLVTRRAQSASCLDLAASNTSLPRDNGHGSYQQLQTSTSSITRQQCDIDRLRALLPTYRLAPDYETAVQQKYQQQRTNDELVARDLSQQEHHVSADQLYHQTNQVLQYSSQPEIHTDESAATYLTHLHHLGLAQPDVTQTAQPLRAQHLLHPFYDYVTQHTAHQTATPMQLLHLYKPPPPYPSNRLSSNSTPDLAIATGYIPVHNQFAAGIGHVSGSSPDLVSTRSILNRPRYFNQYGNGVAQVHYAIQQPHHLVRAPLIPQSASNGYNVAYENLATVLADKKYLTTNHIKKIYDDRGNILYCMPTVIENQSPQTIVNTPQITSHATTEVNGNEPIYENVPYWSEGTDINDMYENLKAFKSHANEDGKKSETNERETKSTSEKASGSQELSHVEIKVDVPSSPPIMYQTYESTHTETSSVSNRAITNPNVTTITQTDRELSQCMSSLNSTSISTSSSTTESTSSKTKKKKKWHNLLANKSGAEKYKSATLGREKGERCVIDAKERHRWSTGLPRQPLPPTITKETMCQLLERKLVDSQLFYEFEKIAKKKVNAQFTTALLTENAARNRYQDVYPYDDNRVRLIPTKDNKTGYINASPITATVGNKQRFYIAAQGPTVDTLEDFWHCVWQADVYLIVQLTDLEEDLCYIPTLEKRNKQIGQYQILLEFSQTNGHCSTTKLQLCNTQSRHYRSIWHMVYGAWGELGCPCPNSRRNSCNNGEGKNGGSPSSNSSAEAHFLAFLEELRSVRDHSVSQDVPPGHNNNPPTLVHCTAGVGRTGVTILSDLLLHILDHNQEMDILRTITQLRQQRPHMVQTVAQYRFVHSLLIHYLKQTRLI